MPERTPFWDGHWGGASAARITGRREAALSGRADGRPSGRVATMIVPAWRSSQRSRAWLSVEGGADPGDLAAADAGDPEGFDEILDPAGADAGDVRLLDDGEERPLGPPARLEEAREVAAVADLGDREADRPHAGIPAPLAVPVAAREPSVGCPLAVGDSGQLGHLGLHRRLGEDPDPLAEEVGVALGPPPCAAGRARPSCHRPSRSPSRRRTAIPTTGG